MLRDPRNIRIPFSRAGVTILAMAASPAFAAVSPITNQYEVAPSGLGGAKATLTSTASCDVAGERCSIENRIVVPGVDRYIHVQWLDRHGNVMVGTTNYSFWGRVFGPTDYTVQKLDAVAVTEQGLFLGINVTSFKGTADFTGTGSGNQPCGIGYVCHDAYYYEFTTFGKSPLSPVAGPAQIGSFTTTFEYVAVDPGTLDALPDTRAPLFEFASTVTLDTDGYHYRYTAINHANIDVPFAWDGIGLTGLLGAGASQSIELLSQAAPALASLAATAHFEQTEPIPFAEDFNSVTTVLRPVPEPGTWVLCIAGLALLGGQGRRLAARCRRE